MLPPYVLAEDLAFARLFRALLRIEFAPKEYWPDKDIFGPVATLFWAEFKLDLAPDKLPSAVAKDEDDALLA